MAREFVVPPLFQNIRDLELTASCNRLHVSEATDVSSLPADEQESFFSTLTHRLLSSPEEDVVEQIANSQVVFDALYSGARYISDLKTETRGTFVELLLSCSEELLTKLSEPSGVRDQAEFRNAFKVVVYFLCKVVFDLEKSGKHAVDRKSSKANKSNPETSDWAALRTRVMHGIRNTLRGKDWVDFGKLWNCGLPEPEFLNLYWQLSETLLLERTDSVAKDSQFSAVVLELIQLVAHRFHSSLSHIMISSFAHSLTKQDKFHVYLATVIQEIAEKFQDTRFSQALLLEVGRLDLEQSGRDLSGIRLIGSFIEQLAERLPELVFANLSVLLPHFNAEAYPIRVSLVKSISQLVLFLKKQSVKELHNPEGYEDPERDTNTRDKLLDLLGERVHDTSSYVRSATLNAWAFLGAQNAIPLAYYSIATDVCIERINDKSSIVRKQAIASLGQLVLSNPYNSSLSTSTFTQKIMETESWLQDHGENLEDEEVKRSKLEFLQYCKDALGFISKVECACESVKSLQCSKTMSDVLECMRFLSVLHRFNVRGTKESIRSLFILIWDTRESGRVRKELLETFEHIYVSRLDAGMSGKRLPYSTEVITSNIVALASTSSLAELTSLEKILSESVKSDGILGRRVLPYAVVDRLWEVAAMTFDVNEDDEDLATEEIEQACRAALCILAALSKSKACQINRTTTFDTVQAIAFGPGAKRRRDYGLCRFALLSMIRCVEFNKTATVFDAVQIQCMMKNVRDILTWEWESSSPDVYQFEHLPDEQWFPAAEQAVKLLFMIGDEPEKQCTQLLQKNHAQVFKASKPSMRLLSRFVFLLGHIAVKLCILAERITSEMKKTRAEATTSNTDKEEAESGLLDMNQGGDDFEDGIVRRLLEMAEPSILTAYIPCLLTILSGKLKVSTDLKASAASTLCRLMCVSEVLCEAHLPYVLTILRDAEEFSVRANIIISLGDLASRFPNVVEPYTRHIYNSLRDDDSRVRKNTLMVLTHLILNDMVKVRGEVSELAVCLEDEDPRVRDLAGLFFTELSKRGSNPVYNLLPDTLASLSRSVAAPQFARISKFLLSFLEGEKKILSTAEKLCLRIYAASGVSRDESIIPGDCVQLKLIRDLAFCLAQLKYSEKNLQKLSEPFFKHYQPVLVDKTVFSSFQSIAKRSRQVAKSEESKHGLEEWNQKLEQIHHEQVEDLEATIKARGQNKSPNVSEKGKPTKPEQQPLQHIN